MISTEHRTGGVCTHGFQRDWDSRGLTVTHDLKLDGFTGTLLPDFHLKLPSIRHGLSVQFSDDIASPQPSLPSGRVGLNLGHDGSGGIAHPEESGIVRSHIRNANSAGSVTHFTVGAQGLTRGPADRCRTW